LLPASRERSRLGNSRLFELRIMWTSKLHRHFFRDSSVGPASWHNQTVTPDGILVNPEKTLVKGWEIYRTLPSRAGIIRSAPIPIFHPFAGFWFRIRTPVPILRGLCYQHYSRSALPTGFQQQAVSKESPVPARANLAFDLVVHQT